MTGDPHDPNACDTQMAACRARTCRAKAIARLSALAHEIVANSTAPEAEGFDTDAWLVCWLQRPQLALGGRTPDELIDTPEGTEAVVRVLGAIESGSYL